MYYVASSEGYGCGFLSQYGEDEEEGLQERRALSKLLDVTMSPEQRFQLLIAYDGYERNEVYIK